MSVETPNPIQQREHEGAAWGPNLARSRCPGCPPAPVPSQPAAAGPRGQLPAPPPRVLESPRAEHPSVFGVQLKKQSVLTTTGFQ